MPDYNSGEFKEFEVSDKGVLEAEDGKYTVLFVILTCINFFLSCTSSLIVGLGPSMPNTTSPSSSHCKTTMHAAAVVNDTGTFS